MKKKTLQLYLVPGDVLGRVDTERIDVFCDAVTAYVSREIAFLLRSPKRPPKRPHNGSAKRTKIRGRGVGK